MIMQCLSENIKRSGKSWVPGSRQEDNIKVLIREIWCQRPTQTEQNQTE